MGNVVLTAILMALIGGVIKYLYKAKKSGQTCIGCPHSKNCGGNCDTQHK